MDQVNDRIRRKAFEYYVERGAIDGRDFEDWLRAESAIVEKPNTDVRRMDHTFVIEIDIPATDPEDILLFVGPREIAVATTPRVEEKQILRIIQLPECIETNTVDAEFTDDGLCITAKISEGDIR
jgi:HSP20 family molecular chaperone IbpA